MTCCAATGFAAEIIAAVAMAGGGAKIPVVAQRLSSHTKASVVTAVQPAFATAVGAVMLSARQPIEQQDGQREERRWPRWWVRRPAASRRRPATLLLPAAFLPPRTRSGRPTGTFGIPTAGAFFDDPSERLTELAWSQADDSGDEPVFYTGEPYDTDDNRATPSQLHATAEGRAARHGAPRQPVCRSCFWDLPRWCR